SRSPSASAFRAGMFATSSVACRTRTSPSSSTACTPTFRGTVAMRSFSPNTCAVSLVARPPEVDGASGNAASTSDDRIDLPAPWLVGSNEPCAARLRDSPRLSSRAHVTASRHERAPPARKLHVIRRERRAALSVVLLLLLPLLAACRHDDERAGGK